MPSTSHVFSYPSLHGSVSRDRRGTRGVRAPNARRRGRVHLVGHSLGGAIVYRALEQGLRRTPGNTVVLGSPLNGSRAASGAARFAMLRPLLGPHVLTN